MIKERCLQPDRLKNYINFLLAMTEKEIKARYKKAVLGFLWIILNPLFQMLIIGFIFKNFVKIPVDNYFLFLFPGLLLWNFFSYSLTKATPSIVYERDLIQKSKFPREAIPLSIVFSNFFHFLASTFLLFIFLIIVRNTYFLNLSNLLKFIFSLTWMLALTASFSLLFSSLNVKYRDINFFVQALVILWFYATPVIYSLNVLPSSLIPFFKLNPVVYPFEMFRSAIVSSPLPAANVLLANVTLSIVVIFSSIVIFIKENLYFSDWL